MRNWSYGEAEAETGTRQSLNLWRRIPLELLPRSLRTTPPRLHISRLSFPLQLHRCETNRYKYKSEAKTLLDLERRVQKIQRELAGREINGLKCGLVGRNESRGWAAVERGQIVVSGTNPTRKTPKSLGQLNVRGSCRESVYFLVVGGGKEPSRGTCGREFSESKGLVGPM